MNSWRCKPLSLWVFYRVVDSIRAEDVRHLIQIKLRLIKNKMLTYTQFIALAKIANSSLLLYSRLRSIKKIKTQSLLYTRGSFMMRCTIFVRQQLNGCWGIERTKEREIHAPSTIHLKYTMYYAFSTVLSAASKKKEKIALILVYCRHYSFTSLNNISLTHASLMVDIVGLWIRKCLK